MPQAGADFNKIYFGLTQLRADMEKNLGQLLNKDINARNTAFNNLKQNIKNFGPIINQLQQFKTASLNSIILFSDYLDKNGFYSLSNKIDEVIKISNETGIHNLIKLADYLDKNKFYSLANKVDETLLLYKTAMNFGFCPKNNQKNNPEFTEIKSRSEGALSSRYCPDHVGVQTVRIEPDVYQCPIDGKKYNYRQGYVNYDGQRVPGGSIEGQTESTTDFGGMASRYYDSKSEVFNRLT